ncbi:MAG: FAD-binding domain [Candidatus Sulfotelmatobacter sp.]
MKILISGAGIAGPTLAYWLAHYGMTPTLVEKSPRLRTGGNIIDFWGAGFDVADRMGLMPEIRRRGYLVNEVRVVDTNGKCVAGFPALAVARIAQGRYISIARGDLAETIFNSLADRVETIFGNSIKQIEQSGSAVHVLFESGAQRQFDLVVGADGLHSRVRELVFGPQEKFEKYLGYKAAAFETAGYRPRDELVYVMYTEVGRQIGRFALRGDRTMFLFTFADDSFDGLTGDTHAQKKLIRRHFANSGWECPQILKLLDETNELYFDRVSQIRMDPQQGLWTRGRVTLVGDAASCISLLAGQGSALAMVAAFILAGELDRAGGNHVRAFANYQERFGAFALQKQNVAPRFAGIFAPKSEFALFVRNRVMNLLTIPWIADLAVGRDLADKIMLPDYDQPSQ